MKNIIRITGVILVIFMIHSCTEKPTPPVITTTAVTEISDTTATSGGDATDEGGSPIVSKGVCWNTSAAPTIMNTMTIESGGLGAFTSSLTQLTPNTKYFVRAYATNNVGTSYGNEISFTTLASVPTLTTTAVSSITQTTLTSGGDVTSDGGAPVTTRGVCWSTSENPTIALSTITTDGTGTGPFPSFIIGLTPNTPYYVRAYATNNSGTAYGNEITFTLWINQSGPQVNDIDGNTYNSVKIWNQVWIKENLKTTVYNDGTAIPNITNGIAWAALTTPAYCWANNDEASYKATYGALYNWYTLAAASNGGKNVCPIGWHVSTNSEWTTLITYLGGGNAAGDKLKETGTTHWAYPNTGTNESGFTALAGGFRFGDGTFNYNGDYPPCFLCYGDWWSSTESNTNYAYLSGFVHDNSIAYNNDFSVKRSGFSVRCIKDN